MRTNRGTITLKKAWRRPESAWVASVGLFLAGLFASERVTAQRAGFVLVAHAAAAVFFRGVLKDRRRRKIVGLAATVSASAALLLPYEALRGAADAAAARLRLPDLAGLLLAAGVVFCLVSLFFLLAALTLTLLRGSDAGTCFSPDLAAGRRRPEVARGGVAGDEPAAAADPVKPLTPPREVGSSPTVASRPAGSPRPRPKATAGVKDVLKYSLFPLLGFLSAVLQHYPARLTRDSFYQLAQIHGAQPLDNVHTVGHTLFASLLMSLWDSPAVVTLFQAALLALLFGWALTFFASKGVAESVLLPTAALIAVFPANREIVPYFWKDVLYTAAVLMTTILLMKMVESRRRNAAGRLSLSLSNGLGLAVGLAGVGLFRHNGFLVIGGLLLFFLWRAVRFRECRPLAATLLSLVLAAAVYGYAFGVLAARPTLSGARWAIFGKAVVAVVVEGGNLTPEEARRVDALIPRELARKYYRWDRGEDLLWDHGRSEPPYRAGYRFHEALEARRQDVVGLFFQLFPRNALLMARDLGGSSCIVWRFSLDWPKCNALFVFLLIPVVIVLGRRRPLALLPFAPVLLSGFSILISVVTNEWRYLYPTLALFPVLLLYAVQSLGSGTD